MALHRRDLEGSFTEFIFEFKQHCPDFRGRQCTGNVCRVQGEDCLDSPLFTRMFVDIDLTMLHMAVVKGAWRHEQWGPSEDGGRRGGGAVQHGITVEASSLTSSLEEKWSTLSEALAVLSCSSLGPKPTVYSRPFEVGKNHWVQYVPHADSGICIESLIAWKTRLLPAHILASSTIGRVLDPRWLLSAAYQAVELHSTRNPESGEVDVSLRFRFVADPTLTEKVAIGISAGGATVAHAKAHHRAAPLRPFVERRVYDSRAMDLYNAVTLSNPFQDEKCMVHVVEPIPEWYDLHVYSCVTDRAGVPSGLEVRAVPSAGEALASRMFSTVQWQISVPPQQSLTVTCRARKRHMHRDAMPPGASRGLEVPPPRVQWTCPSHNATYAGPFSLVTVPIPDATMPYNVITIVCSLAAFMIGSIMKTLMRRRLAKHGHVNKEQPTKQ